MFTLKLPTLRHDQWEIVTHPSRFRIVMMGRRWGKTVMGGITAIAVANHGFRVAWVSPTFPQSRALWHFCLNYLAPLEDSAISISRSDRTFFFLGSKGSLTIYSAQADTTIRGNAFDLVIIDEAARIPEDVWTATILPTLADSAGFAILISTPKGKNWFYREWLRGKQNDPLYSAWQAPSYANPLPSIQLAYQQAKERLPKRIFEQEWNAIPVDDAGGVFVGVRELARNTQQKGDIILAADIGRDEDYTAVAAFDIAQQAILWVKRWNALPYTETTQKIANLAKETKAIEVAVEANAMGAVIADYLIAANIPVTPVYTTRASKQRIIEQLAAAIEHKEITLPQDDYVLTELENFTAIRRPDGSYEYAAIEGLHDDCVIAIAWAFERGRLASSPPAEILI